MKRSFEMPVDEIVMNYRQSKNKSHQVEILAQLNICKPWEIIWVLVENGVDPRSFNKSAFLRNSYEMAKEKGLQPPAKKLSDINAEITPEEAPEQNPEPDEKVVIIPETENEVVTIKPDQSEEDSRIVIIPVDSFASEEPGQEEEQLTEEEKAVMDECTIESLSDAIEDLESKIETLNKEIAYLQGKNKEYLEKIQELHESARRSKAEALELREGLDGLGETIEKKDASIQHLLSENADLKKSLAHHKVSDFNATTDSMQKELEIKKLKESIAFYSDEREGDGLTIAALKHENEELKTKVTAAEHYILNMLVYGNPFS